MLPKHFLWFATAGLLSAAHIAQIAVAQGNSTWPSFKILPIVQGSMAIRPAGTYELKSQSGEIPLIYERSLKKLGPDKKIIETKDQITITSEAMEKARGMLQSASDLAQKEGFKSPIVEKVGPNFIGRIHPGTFACDEETGCDPKDETYGVYRGTAQSGGTTVRAGKLFISDSWQEAKSAVVTHELFHGIVAAYPGFNVKQQSGDKCATACWLDEGLAEGFAKYWADTKGASYGYGPKSGYTRTRTYDSTLATGRGEEEYSQGMATGRFWRFVSKLGGSYRPMSAILENGAIVGRNNGIDAVNAGLKKSLRKNLSEVYGEFARRELNAKSTSDFSKKYDFKHDAEEMTLKTLSIWRMPHLSTYPVKLSLKADPLEWPTLRITPTHLVNKDARVYWNDREIKSELRLATKDLPKVGNKDDHTHEIWLKISNTSTVSMDGAQLKLEWLQDKCELLPAASIKRMVYKSTSDNVESIFTYNFGARKMVGEETHFPAQTTFQSIEKKSKSRAKGKANGTWKCTTNGVAMDGLIAGGAMNMRVRENATMETTSNTLRFPSNVKANQSLPGGSVNMLLKTAGVPATNFTATVSNRRVVGQEMLTIPGIGRTKCWKITADISYGAKSGQGMQNMIEKQLRKNPFYQTAQGKALLADPAFRRTLMSATNGVLGTVTSQSGGSQTVWFKRGLGLVKTVTKDKATGKLSTLSLQSVVYR